MVVVYYSERIQIKIGKGRRWMDKVKEKPGACLQVRVPVETHGNALNSPSNSVCQPTCVGIANQGSALSPAVQGFYYRSVM